MTESKRTAAISRAEVEGLMKAVADLRSAVERLGVDGGDLERRVGKVERKVMHLEDRFAPCR